MNLSRNIPINRNHSALLFVDVQNLSAHPEGLDFKSLSSSEFEAKYGWYFDQLNNLVIPNMQSIQKAARKSKIEILYCTIESLTLDGRDCSLDYKISGLIVPRGDWNARVIDQIAPKGDEIVLSKSSSSVFISTQIDFILRNLGVRQLIISGLVTDQCVESAIRDACDLGYLVTQITDACLTYSASRQENSLSAIKGYCRQITTQELVTELAI